MSLHDLGNQEPPKWVFSVMLKNDNDLACYISTLIDQFLPRDAMLSAVYAAVCVCVCLSHSSMVSKRLNVGSRK